MSRAAVLLKKSVFIFMVFAFLAGAVWAENGEAKPSEKDKDTDSGAVSKSGVKAPSAQPRLRVVTGEVSATHLRPIKPAKNAEMAERLKRFEVAPEAFKWKLKPIRKKGKLIIYSLTFPSPEKTPDEVNNTVHCEYFPGEGEGKKASVIILHGMDGKFILERMVAETFASNGINALVLQLPYYGDRRPAGKSPHALFTNPETLPLAVTQAVKDTRRAARWLTSRPEVDSSRIGLVGISLGGLVGSLATSVDGDFKRVVLVAAGGDIAKVISHPSRETHGLRRMLSNKGITNEALVRMLMPIEPLNFAARLKDASVLMFNARADNVIPPDCSKELQKASNAKILWYDANHYSFVMYLPVLTKQALAHFKAEKWD